VQKGIFGPALLGLGRLAELGPLGPAPAHPRHSLRDGLTFRFRGGIRRAGGVEGRTAKGRPDRSPDRVGAGTGQALTTFEGRSLKK